jgi:hypothetical protein
VRKEVIVQKSEEVERKKKEVIGRRQMNSFQRKILIPKKVNPLKDGGTKPTGPE